MFCRPSLFPGMFRGKIINNRITYGITDNILRGFIKYQWDKILGLDIYLPRRRDFFGIPVVTKDNHIFLCTEFGHNLTNNQFQRHGSSNIHKSGIIHIGIRTCIIKCIQDFPVIPDKKCLYKKRMEWADSIASMNNNKIYNLNIEYC